MTVTTTFAHCLDHAADLLAESFAGPGSDPFAPRLLALGHHAQEAWLRHQLATRLGVAAVWQVLSVDAATDAALRACLEVGQVDPQRWWDPQPGKVDPWAPEPLRGRVLAAFRQLADHPDMAEVRGYLYGDHAPADVAWRELALAAEVAAVLGQLMRQRWDQALLWARDPDAAVADKQDTVPAWLRRLCQALELAADDTPCSLRARVMAGNGTMIDGPELVLFGLSALSPGGARVLARLGQWIHLRQVRVVCSPGRWSAQAPAAISSPLLQALGRAEELERQRLQAPADLPPLPDPGESWLARLQHSARDDQAVPQGSWPSSDPLHQSVSFHRCYGPLRQVELLRQTLLGWFAADPDLEPRNVLVLTPDLERHASLVQWIFSRRGAAPTRQQDPAEGRPKDARPPLIEVAVPDLGLSRTNPVAEALLSVLELCERRVDAPRLYALLGLSPVRQRFGLSPDDVADLRALLVESGLRWGLDGADRGRDEQPPRHQNTLEFGLERLALGTLMPDEGLEQGIPHDELGPLVPQELDGRSRAFRVAQLIAIVRAVGAARARFNDDPSRTPRQWRDALVQLLDDFTDTSDASAWLRVQTEQALDQALPTDEAPGPGLQLGALRRLLVHRFELPQGGGRVVSGAVSVRRLALDAPTPHKVVALLGMDDGAFPCSPRPRQWDPFATPADGEHDPRGVDRLALLQSVLCAGQRLFISWSGHEMTRGEGLPPCVPVGELVDLLAQACGQPPEELVQDHARQPWSRKDLQGDVFDAGLVELATKVAALQDGEDQPALAGLAVDRDQPLPAEEHPVTDLPLEALARDLVNPCKLFLYQRVGVFLEEQDEPVPGREPLELSALDNWTVRDEALRLLSETSGERGATTQDLVRRFAGLGQLPLQAGGERKAAQMIEQAEAMQEVFAAVKGEVVNSKRWTVQLPCKVTVSGAAQQVRQGPDGELLLQWLDAGAAISAKRRLKAWVHLLAAKCCQQEVAGARVVGNLDKGKPTELWLVAPAEQQAAKDLLDALVTRWKLGRRRALPLFAHSSLELATKAHSYEGKLDDPEVALKLANAVRVKWWGKPPFTMGDIDDRWVAAIFGDYDPSEDLADLGQPKDGGFVSLALSVWAPVVAAGAAQNNKQLKASWKSKGGAA